MDTQVMNLIQGMNHVSEPQFLLVQGNILGVCRTPMKLPYRDLDHDKPWEILIGTVNKFDAPEVIGVVAKAYPSPGKSCLRISSSMDGDSRLVGCVTSLLGLLVNRLRTLYRGGSYSDLCCLPQTIIVIACDSGAPIKKGSTRA